MVTPEFFEKLTAKAAASKGMSLEEFKAHRRERYDRLNARLNEQVRQQRMTPELLNKVISL